MPEKLFVNKGIPAIHYGHIFTKYGIQTKYAATYLAPEDADELTRVYPGDLLVANTSKNLEDVGKGVMWLGDVEGFTGAMQLWCALSWLTLSFLVIISALRTLLLKNASMPRGRKLLSSLL